MNGEGFAFFAWHRWLYPNSGAYCATHRSEHRDYCMNKWENFRRG